MMDIAVREQVILPLFLSFFFRKNKDNNDTNNDDHHDQAHDWWKEELRAILDGFTGGGRYGIKIRFPHTLIMTLLFPKFRNSMKDNARYIVEQTMAHASRLATYAALYKLLLSFLKYHYKQLLRRPTTGGGGNNHISPPPQLQDSSTSFLLSRGSSLVKSVVSLLLHGQIIPSSSTSSPSSLLTIAPAGYPQRHYHALLAGMVSGMIAWGTYSPLNYQILLYLTSRIAVGLWKRAAIMHQNNRIFNHNRNTQSVSASQGSSSSAWLYRCSAGLIWGLSMILFEECPNVLHPSLRKSMQEIFHRYRRRPN